MTLQEKLEKLVEMRYNAHIVPGNNFIHVNGFGGPHKYFKAKQKAANSITFRLDSLPFIAVAWDKKAADGFYDFYVK